MPICLSSTLRRCATVFALGAACSGTTPPPATRAEAVTVPLTAASASIATSGPVRDEVVPPWSLTASDGSGLVLTRV